MFFPLLVFLFTSLCTPSLAGTAQLVVGKEVVNLYGVANRELTVRYSIFNIGDGPAKDVVLDDDNYKEGFTVEGGLTKVKYPSIAEGVNVTHNIVVIVDTPGTYNLSAAKITYIATDGEDDEQMAFSSRPINFPVFTAAAYSRQREPHTIQWAFMVALFFFGLLLTTPTR